jgi:hypothetical protein
MFGWDPVRCFWLGTSLVLDVRWFKWRIDRIMFCYFINYATINPDTAGCLWFLSAHLQFGKCSGYYGYF